MSEGNPFLDMAQKIRRLNQDLSKATMDAIEESEANAEGREVDATRAMEAERRVSKTMKPMTQMYSSEEEAKKANDMHPVERTLLEGLKSIFGD